MNYEDIAIIGMSGRFPEAENLQQFWQNLANARDSIRDLPATRITELEHIKSTRGTRFVKNGYLNWMAEFEPGYFDISAEEAKYIDPQQRMSLELIEEAIQDAGYDASELRQQSVGIFMAHSSNTYRELLENHPLGVVNGLDSAMAGRVAYTFDFDGPTMTIDTACSSSLVALHTACLNLMTEQCQVAVVGGCQIFVRPATWQGMQDYPVFAKNEKLAAFSADAEGTLGGEGGGAFLLKPLAKAQQDNDVIHAVIKGSALNSDAGKSNGMSSPSKEAQAKLIRQALSAANLTPDDIDYIEAHGTGTELGDPIEVGAIAEVFENKKQKMPIGTVKSNIGHLVGMAGFAGVTKAILSLKHQQLPASLHFDKPNPHIDFENLNVFVNDILCPLASNSNSKRIGVSSFGIIGTNAHVILEQPPVAKTRKDKQQNQPFLVPLSARSDLSLFRQVQNLNVWLETNIHAKLEDIAYTLSVGRRHLAFRAAFIASSTQDLHSQVRAYLESPPIVAMKAESKLFLFPECTDWSNDEALVVDNYLSDLPDFNEKSSFTERLTLSKFTQNAGIKPKGVLGWGNGKLVANILSGKLSKAKLLDAIQQVEDVNESELVSKLFSVFDKGFDEWVCFDHQQGVFEGEFKQKLLNKGIKLRFISDFKSALELISTEYQHGLHIDWHSMYQNVDARRISMPAYQFERTLFLPSGSSVRSVQSTQQTTTSKVNGATLHARVEQIRKVLLSNLAGEADMSLSFEENGGDSLDALQVQEQLASAFGEKVSLETIFSNSSLEQLTNIILTQVAPASDSNTPSSETMPNFTALKDLCSGFLTSEPNLELSFEDNGGVSLDAIEIADRVESEYGIKITLEELFSFKSIRELIDYMLRGAHENEEKALPELSSFCRGLQDPIDNDCYSKHILITGATGFFGAHLVSELLEDKDSLIYCLVRASDEFIAEQRLRETLHAYFGETYQSVFGERLIAVPGDISQDNLAMSEQQYVALSKRITDVINAAADVRQVARKEEMFKVNVEGTQRLISFCLTEQQKSLHHCSTYTVSGRTASAAPFAENDLDRQQFFLGSNYAESKFESEKLIHTYRDQGLQASIYRIGNLSGRFSDGKFQTNFSSNLLYSSWRAIGELGHYTPAMAEDKLELCPVDLCASAFCKLLHAKNTVGHTFHLMNPTQTSFMQIITALKNNGFALGESSKARFSEELETAIEMGDSGGLFRRLKLLYGSKEQQSRTEDLVRPTYAFDQTAKILKEVNFNWPDLDADYVEKIVEPLARWELPVSA
ncbi:hypothetical protein A7985_14690 [Pseudoalteromonas luteoviolacea]|uniref:Carrier domain-containing protein n=1 Tax=Pseudoalteromonas luteoviolacea TaxID=43657 RepID=A0A1C0TQI6_9GAMM|nr:beta-ketoacyl synthase N-terminal-like domain-containing protein [Pseudoalteromonas luteoviolacea]OCQ21028.1 hypothetical protein A7985_14690 [Pseudoalteromonas luteoviolacea]